MARISPRLKALLAKESKSVDLIIRLNDDPAKYLADLRARGFTVKYTYALTLSAAIHGPASAARALGNEPWVVSMEEDKPVRAS